MDTAGTASGAPNAAAAATALAALRARAGHKSHNARALALKAVSYQKRQLCTNICCIGLCPLFFVLISAVLGRVIQTLLLKSLTIQNIQFCSNNNSLSTDGFPIFNSSDPSVYGANVTDGKSVNYIRNVNLAGFLSFQLSTFAITGSSTPELAKLLGTKPKVNYSVLQAASLFTDNTTLKGLAFPNYTSDTASSSYGILGSIGQRLYANLSLASSNNYSFNGFIPVPYFQQDSSATTPDILDNDIGDALKTFINQLATLDKSVLQKSSPSAAELSAFYLSASVFTAQMPYGSVFLDTIGTSNLSSRVVLSVGSDKRLEASSNFASKGQRLFSFITQLNQGFTNYWAANVASTSRLFNATITQGIRAFPDTQSTSINFEFGGLIGRILYPFGVSFLLPIFVIVLVKG
ncbi:hypothetical protein HK405_005233 [Cladochytrium tenue]|nr:hypothetical protein HK405_005233 [Cladochytrium tenue]